MLEGVADDVEVVVPGHGSVGGAVQVRVRIEQGQQP
jgi:ribosomal protein S28E/S33